MTDAPDAKLLEEFARDGSEAAFAELVERHIALVYSVAVRHTVGAPYAQDITQAVFIILARKAGTLSRKTVLSGWLYHTAQLTAANFQRTERRRLRHEQEAFMQSTTEEPANDTVWREMSPQLDEAMAKLGMTERDALVLRYFQNKSMAEVGQSLGLQENAAQKRVGRALEKLRKFFAKRGVVSTTVIIAGAMAANSVQAAPAGLAQTISSVALAKGAVASASTLTLVKGVIKLMMWSKINTTVAVGVGVLLAVGTATLTVKAIGSPSEYYKGKTLKEWLVTLDDQHPGPDDKQSAAAVRYFGTNGLPTIISMLNMDDPMHHNAVLACQILGPKAKPAMPYLVDLMKHGYTSGYVGVALDRIGPDAVPVLLDLITNENLVPQTGQVPIGRGVTEDAVGLNDSIRIEAVHSLGSIEMYSDAGTNALADYDVHPVLLAGLNSPSPYVRRMAVNSLGEIKGDNADVIPALIKILSDKDSNTRWLGCVALGAYGPSAEMAVPALQAALKDPSTDVQATAAIALIQIEPDNMEQFNAVLPILNDSLTTDRTQNFRYPTAEALGALGSKAKPALPALVQGIKKSSGYEQQAMLADLKKIDPEAYSKASGQ